MTRLPCRDYVPPRKALPAWINFTSVIPWSSHGMTPNAFFDPPNKASFITNLGEILDGIHRRILLHHYDFLDDQNLSVIHLVRLNVIYL
ncbi:hypothetical protein [Rickettsia asembonensis]|uniref:hypothetical protein n=1 Tax=Rickettsia asembonensis TaxID=1068590 RepID=UPI0018F14F00|nr:hypothetical protein [Rickettsia asembonensis]